MPFIDGFLVGFAMIIFVGPVLFTILQITLNKGYLAGFIAAFGVFISDVACVLICYYGARNYINQIENSIWVAILGAIILFSIGIVYIIKPNLNVSTIEKVNTLSMISSFTKGFLVNFVNPFVFGVWLAVIGLAKQNYTSEHDIILYLFAATFAVLLTDTLKVIFANKIRPMLKPTLLIKIYRFSGIALILFGIRVLAHIF